MVRSPLAGDKIGLIHPSPRDPVDGVVHALSTAPVPDDEKARWSRGGQPWPTPLPTSQRREHRPFQPAGMSGCPPFAHRCLVCLRSGPRGQSVDNPTEHRPIQTRRQVAFSRNTVGATLVVARLRPRTPPVLPYGRGRTFGAAVSPTRVSAFTLVCLAVGGRRSEASGTTLERYGPSATRRNAGKGSLTDPW